MELLELSKPQVYRITAGKAAPTLESLVRLRELNISIDAILDSLSAASRVAHSNDDGWVDGKVEISGVFQHCFLKLSPISGRSAVIAIPKNDHAWHVSILADDSVPPGGAMRVDEIQFRNAKPRLAIVDDHPGTLTALCKQLESGFDVSPFLEGRALLEAPMLSQFDGYLVDWKLPDISGEELVMAIRGRSEAPIFVVTGEKSSHGIAKIIASANVRYVVKPIDEVILAAELMNAITLHLNSQKLTSL